VTAVVSAVLLVAVVAGWALLRFDAPTRPVAGTPFRLRAQAGVPVQQAAGVEVGLRAHHDYMRGVLGSAIEQPVEVRMSWSRGCELGLGPASVSTAWAKRGLLCLNAAHPRWKRQAARFAWFPAYVAAHEAVHAWQAEVGCHHSADEQRWQWLFEGMADELAFAALDKAGQVTDAQAVERIRLLGGLDVGVGSLGGYETPNPRTGAAYPLFHLGARVLARTAGSGHHGFAEFCRAEARGDDWRQAFAVAFGLTPEELYTRVEQERARLAG
jgi:hypothetical protein